MRDALGNELAIGDLVHVKVGTEWVPGRIMNLQNGGLAVSGVMPKPGDKFPETPDAIVIQIAAAFPKDVAGMPHADVMKLVQPPQQNSTIQ